MRTETDILAQTYTELDLNNWYKDLLGQEPKVAGFDFYKAFETIPRTELVTAQAIAAKYKHRLTYVPESKTWYLWDGMIHRPCNGDAIAQKIVMEYYATVLDSIKYVSTVLQTEEQAAGDDDKRVKAFKAELSKHKKFRDSLATDRVQKSVINQLRIQVDVADDHYEKDNGFLVLRNGVIDLADFKASQVVTLLPHNPARPVYRFFDADYVEGLTPDAYPNWRRFLASSIVDWDTACLLQKGVGAAFAATHKPRAMFNLLGAPASGKSLFLSVFDKLGEGYSVMPNNQAVQANNGDTNPYQDDLKGARFVGFSEVQGKKPLDDGFIKGVMGGDKQNTRKLYARQTSWVPQCVMFVASNMALKIDTRDAATFGKVLPIPFPHSFTDTDPEHKIDLELEEKVLAERNGIVHWILQGMVQYWETGLHPTAAVMAAMDDNKTANSHSLQFIAELKAADYLTEDLSARTSHCLPIGEAYELFKLWADENGVRNVPGKQTFSTDIAEAYHGKKKSDGWTFVGLLPSEGFTAQVRSPISRQIMIDNL